MKIATKIICIFFLSHLIVNTYGQEKKNYFDTIKIDIDDEAKVVITTYNKHKLYKDSSLQSIILSLETDINRIEEEIPKFDYYLIHYSPEKNIVFEEFTPKNEFVVKNGTIKSLKPQSKCIIQEKNYDMILFFEDMNCINNDLQQKINKVISDLPTKGLQANTMNYDFNNNVLTHNTELDKKSGDDVLSIYMPVGASLVKNQPLCDITIEMNFQFSSHGLSKNIFYYSNNFYFVFDENNNIKENLFMNVGWRHNTSFKLNDPYWLGFEVGYLLKRSGDFFDKNTFRLALTGDISKNVSASPQFYFYDDLKKVYPGLRIGFSF